MARSLPRVCHIGLQGPDVLAYSRVYRRLGIRHLRPTRHYGLHMVGNTKHFQAVHGLRQTGTVNEETFARIVPHLNGVDKLLLDRAEHDYYVTPRKLVVGALLSMLRVAPCPYRQVRPYPRTVRMFDEVGSDCSGSFTLAYLLMHDHYPGIGDPNGLGYDGYGFTGTLDAHGRRVSEPRPGDAVFWYPDHGHVGGYLGNGRCFSHGGTGDPHVISLAGAVEYRSYLP